LALFNPDYVAAIFFTTLVFSFLPRHMNPDSLGTFEMQG